VRGAVHLAKLPEAGAALTGLVNAWCLSSARLPQPFADHQLPDSLDRQLQLVRLAELLTGKGWAEVLILGADEGKSLVKEFLRQVVIASAVS
jgi:hypothetical protein